VSHHFCVIFFTFFGKLNEQFIGGVLMAEKSKQKKEAKKAPLKSLKEKRKAKEEKKKQ
jgi:hypothetical protein